MKPTIVLLLVAAPLAACSTSSTPAPSTPPETKPPVEVTKPAFRVENGFLRDADDRALLLRGMNLSGGHKHAPYFDFHEPADFARVRDAWGMNAVRFLITWAAVEPEAGVFDEAYLDALEQRMAWAKQARLFVVLDMHQDVYGEGFANGGGDGAPRWTCDEARYASFVPHPTKWFLNYVTPEVTACYDDFWNGSELRKHYAGAWRRVAQRLAKYDDTIVGFDPMNEPYWGSYAVTAFEADVLQPFYEEVTAAVREERPQWIAFLEPGSSRNLGIPTSLVKPSFAGYVYAPHSYDRDAESGMGFDPAHREALLANVALLADEAKALGAPLWVGEYGGQPDAPGIVEYMTAQYDGIGLAAGGSMYWDYGKGDGYSALAADGSEKANLLGALVRPWPERVAGRPKSYSFAPDTMVFTLEYEPDASVAAPTIVSVPDRVYPNGYEVECGGCEVERAPGALSITKAAKGPIAVVRLSPK